MSTDRQLSVNVDFDDNRAEVHLTQTIEVTDLFDNNDELQLWEDDAGWSGFIIGDDGRYREVNWSDLDDGWIAQKREEWAGDWRAIQPPADGGRELSEDQQALNEVNP